MPTDPPLPLTTIIPTYNRADSLVRAIDSVRSQQYAHWELIVVDDGSTDDTEAVVTAYEDDRIRYVHQQNAGVACARNNGMTYINGAYFGFLDDDDTLLPDHFTDLVAAIEQSGRKFGMYRGRSLLRYTDGREELEDSFMGTEEDTLIAYWRSPCNLLGTLFATPQFKGLRFNPGQVLLEDLCFFNRALAASPLYQSDAVTAHYTVDPPNQSNRRLDEKLFAENLAALARAYNYADVAARVPWDLYRLQVMHQHLHYVRHLARTGKHLSAVKIYKQSLTYATAADARRLGLTGLKILLG